MKYKQDEKLQQRKRYKKKNQRINRDGDEIL